ncbi:MAG: PAS domain-containing protein [Ferruginibacter sp.]
MKKQWAYGWYKALHQQDRDNIKTNWEKATVNHQPSLSEYRFVQPDGTVRWVMGQAIPEKDNNGNIVGYVGTATDITERKNAELELTESEEKYRVLFYHNPMPSWIIEKDGIAILDANDAALELYGYTREEFLALNVMQLRPQEEYIKYQQHSATMQEAPVEGNIGMWRHIKKDGSPVDVELRAHSIVFNKLPCRMIMAIDITEQKKAEEEIKKSNERFELIARATSDVIWDWNLLTNHLWWNDNTIVYLATTNY